MLTYIRLQTQRRQNTLNSRMKALGSCKRTGSYQKNSNEAQWLLLSLLE